MADKFLSRPDGKQRILGLDLARVKTKARERAVVVSAEIDRFTLFWTADQGSWSQWSRVLYELGVAAPLDGDWLALRERMTV